MSEDVKKKKKKGITQYKVLLTDADQYKVGGRVFKRHVPVVLNTKDHGDLLKAVKKNGYLKVSKLKSVKKVKKKKAAEG